MKNIFFVSLLASVFQLNLADAKEKKVNYRKTQEVNFEGSDVEGQVRSPDGAYLLQKQGVKFMPLYKVHKSFDTNIKDSVEYLR